jgi:hypothetical protein
MCGGQDSVFERGSSLPLRAVLSKRGRTLTYKLADGEEREQALALKGSGSKLCLSRRRDDVSGCERADHGIKPGFRERHDHLPRCTRDDHRHRDAEVRRAAAGQVPTCDGAVRDMSLFIPTLSPVISRCAWLPPSLVAAVPSLSPTVPAYIGPVSPLCPGGSPLSPRISSLSRMAPSSVWTSPRSYLLVPSLSLFILSLSPASPTMSPPSQKRRKTSPSAYTGAESFRAARNRCFWRGKRAGRDALCGVPRFVGEGGAEL